MLAICGVAGLAFSRPASAFQPSPVLQSQEELVRSLESLRPRLEGAKTEMDEALRVQRLEQANRERPPVDTFRVGPLRIVAPLDQVDLAEELFSEVWYEYFANVTDSPSLEGRYFTFQWRVQPELIYMVAEEDGGVPVTRVELFRLTDRTRAQARRRVRSAFSAALLADFDGEAPLRSWLGRGGVHDLELPAAYADLALAASMSGPHRACLAGEAAGCWAAHGLGFDGSLETLAGWYTADERRDLVERSQYRLRLALVRDQETRDVALEPDPELRACLEEGAQATCDRVLVANFGWSLVAPYGMAPSQRWTLFWHAIGTGGEDAWARALERSEADPAELLTHASGLAPDELEVGWRESLVTNRPLLYADLSAARWAVLLWVLIFAAFAMRSTRWRLG